VRQLRTGAVSELARWLKVVLFGVGAMGSRIARFLLEREGVRIVGAVDVAPDKVGRDLGDVLGLGRKLGVSVSNETDKVLSKTKPDIVVHATSSFLRDVYAQLEEIVSHGVSVVSTCEELTYPFLSEPRLARALDALAKRKDVAVLGTGINPGFLMDTLAITLTGACQDVRRIEVSRRIDAATRRLPFQKKIGAGLTVAEFNRQVERKIITGHIGLEQSIGMIAASLGWKLDRIASDPVEPVVAERPVGSAEIKVAAGGVAGIRQRACGVMNGLNVITLDFQAYLGAEEEYDSITIEGTPNIFQRISPCVHGDLGTVALVANSIPKVINASPGLVTMNMLPIPSAALGNIASRSID